MGSRSYIFKEVHKELHKEPLLPMSLVLLAVILAYSFRLIGRESFYPTLFSFCAVSFISGFMPPGEFQFANVSCRNRSDNI